MEKIETSLLANQVYDVLRNKIISGEYEPGEKLDIIKLAEAFGVSRSPVKDAINQLVYDGLLEIIPRKGTYVTELKFTEFMEFLDARLMIEKWAAEKIISEITTDRIEQWGKLIEKMDALLDESPFSFDQYNKLDMKFHLTIVEWTGNKKIKDIFKSLNTHVSLSRIVHSTSRDSTIKRHKHHLQLYEAMKNRDLTLFINIIGEHIGSIKEEAQLQWHSEER